MSTLRRLGRPAALCAALLIAAGCQILWPDKPAPKPYTKALPGPWKDVNVSVKFDANKITISVENYPTQPNDYVRKFELIDNRGTSVGERIFDYGAKTEETFILGPETKEVTVTVTSTGRGKWLSAANPVPVPKP